jgi:formylmethanofuran dehydrogenase subunit E
MDYTAIIDFHGHSCPGLAIGYRMSVAAMAALGVTRSANEELVAVVENDACGVDALQCLTGCTYGKGNLLFRDVGKNVYTLYSRLSGTGVRVVFHGQGVPSGMREDKTAFIRFLQGCPDECILTLTMVNDEVPKPARIRNSVCCQLCHEAVMDTRLREMDGRVVCIPCAESHSHQQTEFTGKQETSTC